MSTKAMVAVILLLLATVTCKESTEISDTKEEDKQVELPPSFARFHGARKDIKAPPFPHSHMGYGYIMGHGDQESDDQEEDTVVRDAMDHDLVYPWPFRENRDSHLSTKDNRNNIMNTRENRDSVVKSRGAKNHLLYPWPYRESRSAASSNPMSWSDVMTWKRRAMETKIRDHKMKRNRMETKDKDNKIKIGEDTGIQIAENMVKDVADNKKDVVPYYCPRCYLVGKPREREAGAEDVVEDLDKNSKDELLMIPYHYTELGKVRDMNKRKMRSRFLRLIRRRK